MDSQCWGPTTSGSLISSADLDRFPPFYVNRSDFWKMNNILKIAVNFPNLNLETWSISCPKNSKAQGMELKRIKIQILFPGLHVPGPPLLEGRAFAASVIEKRSPFSLDPRQDIMASLTFFRALNALSTNVLTMKLRVDNNNHWL